MSKKREVKDKRVGKEKVEKARSEVISKRLVKEMRKKLPRHREMRLLDRMRRRGFRRE